MPRFTSRRGGGSRGRCHLARRCSEHALDVGGKDGRSTSVGPPAGPRPLAACWYGDTIVFDLEVGESSRNVTMYFVDWDQQDVRMQTVQIRTCGGELLDARELTAFHAGKYLTWRIQGRVQVEIRKGTGNNAVISGIFFDR